MKILVFLLIVSICFGTFSYIDTRDYIIDKLSVISSSIDKVSGLIGDDDGFRVDSNSADLLDKYVINELLGAGEPLTIKSLIKYWYESYNITKGQVVGSDREVEVNYVVDFDFDSINPYIYELNTNVYRSDGKYRVVLPCVRVGDGLNEYLLIDPLFYIPVGMDSRFNVKISYQVNAMGAHYVYAPTMLVMIKGNNLYLMSMDNEWSEEYKSGLNINNILDFFLHDDTKYVKMESLSGFISNSMIPIEDYFEEKYVYKGASKIS